MLGHCHGLVCMSTCPQPAGQPVVAAQCLPPTNPTYSLHASQYTLAQTYVLSAWHVPWLCLQLAAMRSRGRAEAARAAALAAAGGPSEPTEQQLLLQVGRLMRQGL